MSPSTIDVDDANGYTKKTTVPSRLYATNNESSLEEFKKLCSQQTNPSDYPLSSTIESNVPTYTLPSTLPSESTTNALQDEWNHILLSGPGVFVVRNLYSPTLLASVNTTFTSLLAAESTTGTKGDHFSPTGTNSRLWNSFSKHALASPDTFAAYYANPYLALIASAWLGPAYRITAQLNIVHPGGAPQAPHRDYHLGFQTPSSVAKFPRAMHAASQLLTLQGAVAHSDMPVAAGPTRVLPHSQKFGAGYVAWREAAYTDYFAEKFVSVPLKQGDGMFFNPGLHHAAGRNGTADVSRAANLLQISSAFGKTMEMIETLPLVESCWGDIRRMYEAHGMSEEVKALVAAVGDGYPFPTNLDRRAPAPSGMAPESEQDVLLRGLESGATKDEIVAELAKMKEDSRA